MRTPQPPGMPPLSLRPDEAAKALGVSRRTIDTLIADRTSGLPVVRVGRAVLIPVDGLRRWLDEQSDQAVTDGPTPAHPEDRPWRP